MNHGQYYSCTQERRGLRGKEIRPLSPLVFILAILPAATYASLAWQLRQAFLAGLPETTLGYASLSMYADDPVIFLRPDGKACGGGIGPPPTEVLQWRSVNKFPYFHKRNQALQKKKQNLQESIMMGREEFASYCIGACMWV